MASQQADLSQDLYRFVINAFHSVPPAERCLSHWVMNPEWCGELRKMTDGTGQSCWLPGRDLLLGLPYVVSADGGMPHLEPDAVPRKGGEG